jgi:hypothetical protein
VHGVWAGIGVGKEAAALTLTLRCDASEVALTPLPWRSAAAFLFQGTHSISERESEMQLHEVLGEGSFGKVYRGTWRGSEVRVHVHAWILPPFLQHGALSMHEGCSAWPQSAP